MRFECGGAQLLHGQNLAILGGFAFTQAYSAEERKPYGTMGEIPHSWLYTSNTGHHRELYHQQPLIDKSKCIKTIFFAPENILKPSLLVFHSKHSLRLSFLFLSTLNSDHQKTPSCNSKLHSSPLSLRSLQSHRHPTMLPPTLKMDTIASSSTQTATP